MAIAVGRFMTRVARELRHDGFVRMSSDLLHDDPRGTAVINVQHAAGWGAPLTFYVNAAVGPTAFYAEMSELESRMREGPARPDPARGGFGLWRGRIRPPTPELARFDPGSGIGDMWVCHDDAGLDHAAQEFVALARTTVIPTLLGLLDPAVALRALRFRVPGYHVGATQHAVDLLTAAGPVEEAPASAATWFIDEHDPADDSIADRTGGTLRDASVIAPDGTAVPCAVLAGGRSLMVQLPPTAAAVFLGGHPMADIAAGVGWGRLTPQVQVFNGAPERVWIQDTDGDAVLVVRRSDRPDDLAYVRLGRPVPSGDEEPAAATGWAMVTVLFTEDFLPAARQGTYTALLDAGVVWGGTVRTTGRSV